MILWRPVYRLSEISLLVRVAFVGIHTSQIKCLTWSMTFFFWYMWSKWRDGWNEYITISFGCYIVFTLFKMIYQQTKGPPILNQKRLRFYRFSEVDNQSKLLAMFLCLRRSSIKYLLWLHISRKYFHEKCILDQSYFMQHEVIFS